MVLQPIFESQCIPTLDCPLGSTLKNNLPPEGRAGSRLAKFLPFLYALAMKKTERIQVSDPMDEVLGRAAKRVEAGELVAFPTETVYGIACKASEQTLQQLDRVKGRTPDKFYTLHIGDVAQLENLLERTSVRVAKLVREALPGPLTLVIEMTPPVQNYVKTWLGQEAYGILCRENTLGIRCPDHPVAQALLRQAACPVVAPSANKTGQAPASDADQVLAQMDGSLSMVLDAGPCPLKQSSTVVKIGQTGRLDLLREGLITQETIEVMGRIQFLFVCTGNTCRSSMAEGIAEQLLTQHLSCKEIDGLGDLGYKVVSAGTMGVPGLPASEGAIAACQDRGIDLSGHRSRALSAPLIEESDFIFTMTRFHRDAVLDWFPEAADRCQLLDVDTDIGDPVGQSLAVYRVCADQIESAIKNRLSELAI